MLLAVIVPKRAVSVTIATKHRYWNTLNAVMAIGSWCSRFRSVNGTVIRDAFPHELLNPPSRGGAMTQGKAQSTQDRDTSDGLR